MSNIKTETIRRLILDVFNNCGNIAKCQYIGRQKLISIEVGIKLSCAKKFCFFVLKMSWNPGGSFNGGFNNSMGGGFVNNTSNANTPGGKKQTTRRLQSVVPVVTRMIKYCQDDFKLFGLPAQIVSIVGRLINQDIQSTKATYQIEDHTGSIKALWWLDSDGDENPKLPAVKEGGYVKVFGTVRTQEGVKTLMVLKMFPVDDCNVINTHLLEVIDTRLHAEASSKNTAQKIKMNNPGANLANSMSMFDENLADNGQLNLTEMQMEVFRFLQAQQSQAGPDRATIIAHFPSNRRKEANEALDFLVNEGHAYSTIDNEHFKATDI
ncbi:hypothetical protein ABEB36_003112 [Hypothenemus hampei]|uniref:Replication protein A C-terminal domain-containing protein n=1 Tax=Hypothenemus hampei TaxID=57062 RepID=A0ABD1FB79_HYPHA